MISTLPTWVAALVNNVGLEVSIMGFIDALKTWWSSSDESIWRFKVVDRVPQSHGRFDINRENKLIDIGLLVLIHGEHQGGIWLSLVLDLHDLEELPHEHHEVNLALEAISCAINIQTLGWLPAYIHEVINQLCLDFQLMLHDLFE